MAGTKKFDSDPYLTELESYVASTKTDERGTWYSFRETLFYPQGGGQSSDKGWVNSNEIIDVQSSEGEIWHLINTSLSDTVSLRLDWDYRFTNMQQHTGQHILSSCFKSYHNLNTVSVHLGQDITMIELDVPTVEESQLSEVEQHANQMIRDNLPVRSIIVDRENLDKFNLRRTIKTDNDQVRLVEIGEIDCVGCGGTHVRSTGEVGLIKVLGAEKIRGHARVKIKIGKTAYQYFSNLHQTLTSIGTKLTTSIEDLPEKIDLMISEKKELINDKKRATDLWLAEYAVNLPEQKNPGCFALKDLNKDQLKILSDHYLDKYKIPCLFISKEVDKIHFYIRFPIDYHKSAKTFVEINKSFFFLKGGGGNDFAVGQIDIANRENFSPDKFFHSFTDFINERSDS